MLLEKDIEVRTNYKGSKETYESVKKQIAERFGLEAAEMYNPNYNCMSYNNWRKNSYQVNRNEKGFISTVIVEKKDKKSGQVLKRYPKKVVLFFENQVTKLA